MRFACETRDRSGKSVERTVEAETRREAIALLEREGLFPIGVREVKAALPSTRRADRGKRSGGGRAAKASAREKRVSARKDSALADAEQTQAPAFVEVRRVPIKELRGFSLQLASSTRAGVPLIGALESIGNQSEHRGFRRVVEQVAADVRGGFALSDALAKHPGVFGEVYCATVAAGEQAGSLDEVLDFLATHIEDAMEVRSDVRSALMYPTVVLLALFGAIGVLVVFVVPRFATFYTGFGRDLPLPTRILIGASSAIVDHLLWWVLALAGGVFGAVSYLRTEGGQRTLEAVLSRTPLIRTMISTANTVQVAQLLGLFTRAGVPLLQGLDTIARAASSARLREDLQEAAELVGSGLSLSRSLEEADCLSPAARAMIATGEDTGSLEQSCEAVAGHLRKELRYLTKNLGTLIEPLLTGMLAVIVLGVALAVFLPMWDMVKIARD